jgi:hypothetical protein
VPWFRRLASHCAVTKSLPYAVPWPRSLVAGLSPRRPGFAAGSIHVGFVVDKVALRQVFLGVLRFSLSISFHRRSPNSYHVGNANVSRHPRLGTRPTPPSGGKVTSFLPSLHVVTGLTLSETLNTDCMFWRCVVLQAITSKPETTSYTRPQGVTVWETTISISTIKISNPRPDSHSDYNMLKSGSVSFWKKVSRFWETMFTELLKRWRS